MEKLGRKENREVGDVVWRKGRSLRVEEENVRKRGKGEMRERKGGIEGSIGRKEIREKKGENK